MVLAITKSKEPNLILMTTNDPAQYGDATVWNLFYIAIAVVSIVATWIILEKAGIKDGARSSRFTTCTS